MEIRFTRTARRHRIGRAHALAAIENAGEATTTTRIDADGNESEEVYFIGTDDRGTELEIIGIIRPDCLLIIHVMPLHYRRKS